MFLFVFSSAIKKKYIHTNNDNNILKYNFQTVFLIALENSIYKKKKLGKKFLNFYTYTIGPLEKNDEKIRETVKKINK